MNVKLIFDAIYALREASKALRSGQASIEDQMRIGWAAQDAEIHLICAMQELNIQVPVEATAKEAA